MKKGLKVTLSFLLAIVFMFPVTPAYAVTEQCSHGYRVFNDRVLNGGVGSYGYYHRYYYADSSLPSDYFTYSSTAVSEWVNTSPGGPNVTTSISIIRTTTKSASTFDVYNTFLDPGVTGEARFYIYSTRIYDPSSQNWGWGEVHLPCSYHDTLGYSSQKRTGIIAHEFGHLMGLSHTPYNNASLMYPYDSGRIATRAVATDCWTINHLYG